MSDLSQLVELGPRPLTNEALESVDPRGLSHVFIVDDPMLALIARFVLDVEHLDVSDHDFLREQVRSIREYVDQHPADQRETRAREWIERYAEHYRVAWQRRVVSDRSTQRRCPDCPLIRQDATARCEVHARWSRLLQEYLGDQISSREYVEETLSLLDEHKSKLRLTLRQEPDRGP